MNQLIPRLVCSALERSIFFFIPVRKGYFQKHYIEKAFNFLLLALYSKKGILKFVMCCFYDNPEIPTREDYLRFLICHKTNGVSIITKQSYKTKEKSDSYFRLRRCHLNFFSIHNLKVILFIVFCQIVCLYYTFVKLLANQIRRLCTYVFQCQLVIISVY